MIKKQDIISRATQWQLDPAVVEKDYVLGWILATIAIHPTTKNHWIFKGGTCIKKCYVETYRFSEDLDFSLISEAPYTQKDILNILNEIIKSASETSGIVFKPEDTNVQERHDKLGRPTFKGKISYSGPLGQIHSLPRVQFDLTNNERIVTDPVRHTIIHPYPDQLSPSNNGILTYTLYELVAEKTRALYERTSPRDLYDVVYLMEQHAHTFDLGQLRIVFSEKCQIKNFQAPNASQLIAKVRNSGELRADWESMLRHQLPALPQLDNLLQRIDQSLQWIDAIASQKLSLSPVQTTGIGETVINPSGIQYWSGNLPIETIRFAGANRLLLQFDYNDKSNRLVEPYSLRQARTGNILLYGWERGETHIKAFTVSKISNLRVTNTTFNPQYEIELSTIGQVNIPMITIPTRSSTSEYTRRTPRARSYRSHSYRGPIYIFQCSYCQKKFRHRDNNSSLREHKDKNGWRCSGRRGYLVDTQYG